MAEIGSALSFLHEKRIIHRYVIFALLSADSAPRPQSDRQIHPIVHLLRFFPRDLKPDNILLDERGHVHLTDFNIAVHYTERRMLTGVAGSLAYMGSSNPSLLVLGVRRLMPSQPRKFYTRKGTAT